MPVPCNKSHVSLAFWSRLVNVHHFLLIPFRNFLFSSKSKKNAKVALRSIARASRGTRSARLPRACPLSVGRETAEALKLRSTRINNWSCHRISRKFGQVIGGGHGVFKKKSLKRLTIREILANLVDRKQGARAEICNRFFFPRRSRAPRPP